MPKAADCPAFDQLAVPAKTCQECGQSSHDYDRDDPDRLLHWTKKRVAKVHGVWRLVCAGESCYKCIETRINHFNEEDGTSLSGKRKESRALDMKWHELRRDRASGEKNLHAEGQIDVQKLLDKGKKTYKKRFQTGRLVELMEFADDNGLEFLDDNNEMDIPGLVAHIRKHMGHNVVDGEDGDEGTMFVEVKDKGLRFERGVEDSVTQRKRQKLTGACTDKEAVEHAAGSLADPLHQGRAGARRAPEHGPSSGSAPLPPASSQDDLRPVKNASSRPVAPAPQQASPTSSRVFSRELLPKTRLRGKTEQGHPATERAPEKADSKPSEDGDAEGVEGAPPKKKARRTPVEKDIDEAEELLDEQETMKTWYAHWSGPHRKREFETLCARLRSKATKVGGYLTVVKAIDLSQNLHAFTDRLEGRQALFDDFRGNFRGLVARVLTPGERDHIMDGPAEAVSHILIHGIQGMISKIADDQNVVPSCIMTALTLKPNGSELHLCLGLIPGDEGALLGHAAQCSLVICSVRGFGRWGMRRSCTPLPRK